MNYEDYSNDLYKQHGVLLSLIRSGVYVYIPRMKTRIRELINSRIVRKVKLTDRQIAKRLAEVYEMLYLLNIRSQEDLTKFYSLFYDRWTEGSFCKEFKGVLYDNEPA